MPRSGATLWDEQFPRHKVETGELGPAGLSSNLYLYAASVNHEIGSTKASLCRQLLMPVGIEQRRAADRVEALAFFRAEFQGSRREIVLELGIVAGADHQ